METNRSKEAIESILCDPISLDVPGIDHDMLKKFVDGRYHWKGLTPKNQLLMAKELLWRRENELCSIKYVESADGFWAQQHGHLSPSTSQYAYVNITEEGFNGSPVVTGAPPSYPHKTTSLADGEQPPKVSFSD